MRRYRLDIENSEISWTGVQPAQEIPGKVYFKAGMICIDDGKVVEAEFIIDMRSIQASDEKLDDKNRNKLNTDLKSADFFNADIYPTAVLRTKHIKVISQEEIDANKSLRVTNPTHEVIADLQLKDITQEITFPVKIIFVNNHLIADAKMNLDRRKWGMDFMLEESFGDKKINPVFMVDAKITAVIIDEMDV